jgi:hypothetical protein
VARFRRVAAGTRVAVPVRVRVILVVLFAGCAMGGSYLGARTPAAGTTTVGIVTRFAGGRNAFAFPQVDFTASYSPSDDVSLHVRAMLVSLGAEALVRWRIVHAGWLHVALAPSAAVGYWPATRGDEEDTAQNLGPGANVLARLNVLASIDLGEADLDLGVFGGVSRMVEDAVPAGDDWQYAWFNYEMQGVVAIGGGALGLTIPSRGRMFRPAVEWMRYIDRETAPAAAPAFRPENLWTVTLSWQY